jgi:signal transduction histidine kinase
MSIRRHLFLLITGLVLVIAIAQVALLFHFKNNVDDEIERRGKAFADRILKYTIDSIENEELTTEFTPESETKLKTKLDILTYIPEHDDPLFINLLHVQINKKKKPSFNIKLELPAEILNTPDKLKMAVSQVPTEIKHRLLLLAQELKSQKMHSIEITENGYRIKLNIKQPHPNKLLKRHLAKQIENMKNIGIEDDNIKIETTLEDGTKKVWHAKTIRKHDPNQGINKRKSQISQLFNYVTLVIIFTTLISIFLVFWLSKRFSKPMQELINGFKQLEEGKFGVQVTPQGVTEVSQTIQRFNTMSNQLVKLSDAESKLQQQNHLTEISDVSKGIAHALRNPMHTIGLAIEQLQNSQLSEANKQKLFNQIQSKIVQLDKNINALLTITSDGLERNQTLLLTALINDVVLELKQTHDASKGKLHIELELDDKITIVGAESEFRSILHTLLFNAYEASLNTNSKDNTLNNNELITLFIKTKKENELAVISITDLGSGIDKSIEPKLFTAHCSSKAEGAGMGLYISKRLVELYYDGTLTVKNNIKDDEVFGVTATCTLPRVTK